MPPEINSARMYAGAGSAPLNAAAASWEAIAAQLAESAAGVAAVLSVLADAWRGPSAAAMTAAATGYARWLTSTAAAAERTASQARAAAAAFETARAATVHPAQVAANRAQLAALVASNLLGQNTAAIMALEAAYAEMWAQDVAAMAEYQVASASATGGLPRFNSAPQVTNSLDALDAPAAQDVPTSILSLLNPNNIPILGLDNGSLLGQYLQSFLSSGPYDVPLSLLALFSNLWAFSAPGTAIADALNNIATADAHAVAGGPPATPTAAASSTVRASVGTAARLGRLCAPSWTQPAPGGQPPPATAARPAGAADTHTPLPLPAPIPVPRGGTPPKQPRPQPEYGGLVRFVTRPPAGG